MINVSFNPLHNNAINIKKHKGNNRKQTENVNPIPAIAHANKPDSPLQTKELNEHTFQLSQVYLNNISRNNKNAMNQYRMTFQLEKTEQIQQLIGFSEYA